MYGVNLFLFVRSDYLPVCVRPHSIAVYESFAPNVIFLLSCVMHGGLRRKSAAARLLRLWVRILSESWMSVVNVVCCQVEVSATSWSLVQRSPTDCGASLCVI